MKAGARDLGFRDYMGITRGTLVKATDDKKMQTTQITGLWGENIKDVEHWHPYGFSTVPLPPDAQKKEEAEVLVANINGNRDHPVVIATADRRHRPKSMQPGEVSVHDDQKQAFKHLRDASVHESPKKTITRLTDSNGAEVATITQEATKTTIKRGNSTTTLEASKITHDVSGTVVVIKSNRVDLGADNAPNAVMTTAGASTKVFSVI